MNKIVSHLKLYLSFISIILIIAFFVQTLINPDKNLSWVYNNAILIFAIEFLSLHSSGIGNFFRTEANYKKPSLILFFIYLIFAVVLAVLFDNFILPIFFILSTINKFFITGFLKIDKKYFGINILLFILPLIIVLIASPYLQTIFPFPQSILDAKPIGATGLFIEVPQTSLVWGIIYFSSILIMNMYLLIKNKHE